MLTTKVCFIHDMMPRVQSRRSNLTVFKSKTYEQIEAYFDRNTADMAE